MKDSRREKKRMRELGDAYEGNFFKKKRDVVFRAMKHLERDYHWVEDLSELCRDHPEF